MLDYSYKAYGKNYLENAHEIFLLNPIATPKEILSKFPPTRIMGGTYDPLRDSYILFFMQLQDAGVDVKFTEYQYYPHSFLNFCFPIPKLLCSCSKQAINRVCFWANEGIFGSAEEEKVDAEEEDNVLAQDFKKEKGAFPEMDEK